MIIQIMTSAFLWNLFVNNFADVRGWAIFTILSKALGSVVPCVGGLYETHFTVIHLKLAEIENLRINLSPTLFIGPL